jgi:hypothetical protein
MDRAGTADALGLGDNIDPELLQASIQPKPELITNLTNPTNKTEHI